MQTMIALDRYEAVIFDLDGVITKTAAVHAAAWKELFDAMLPADQERFSIQHDYPLYVDGRPRYDGIAAFLAARHIELPRGDPSDPPDAATICGMGNRKNELFVARLRQQGVEVYDSTVTLIRKLRQRGVKTAVISSSKNCVDILQRVDLLDLFDGKVDGLDTENLGIPGKPAPDVFLRAAKQLGIEPAHAAVVEDAIVGVEAGRRGDFGFVLGLDRAGIRQELEAAKADFVLADLQELALGRHGLNAPIDDDVVFFLDYDGTLTPIVDRPELARLSPSMRSVLDELSQHYTVAVISGRDREVIEDLIGLDRLIYAGSHGFDIRGPGVSHEHEAGKAFLPLFDQAKEMLTIELQEISGALVERKKYAIAVHYRLVAPSDVDRVEEIVDAMHARFPQFQKTDGKKVFELRPKLAWDKGKAVLWLMDTLQIDKQPLYIGDDTTDEDAFKVVEGGGVAVQERPKPTAARLWLQDPSEVEQFLRRWMNTGH